MDIYLHSRDGTSVSLFVPASEHQVYKPRTHCNMRNICLLE